MLKLHYNSHILVLPHHHCSAMSFSRRNWSSVDLVLTFQPIEIVDAVPFHFQEDIEAVSI